MCFDRFKVFPLLELRLPLKLGATVMKADSNVERKWWNEKYEAAHSSLVD